MAYSIGVDIGGTKVAIAIVNEKGEIIEQTKIPTDLSISPQEMIARISSQIEQVIQKSAVSMNDVIGIGIGAPGPLDSKNGIIKCPPNLKKWVDIPIVNWMQKIWDLPIVLENDANAAALAEKWLGAAQENENFVYMTISTGIGAGIIVDGKLLHGMKGNAGDIGHTVVDPSFGKCTCGQYGCLESIASGTAIAKRASEIVGKELTTKEVFDLYNEGEAEIVDFIERIFRVLGVACVSIINTFDPEKIVIGGGVSKVGDPLFKSIKDYVSQFALNPTGRKTKVVPAKLEQNAGVIGATALCFDVV
ncbi:ROK family protein [Tepidibacillus sp. HK-1]|uniref:ROK family protein n=1 Tax=Tepidibacillus sp. HK-1 TaxID=1883407 RepID=UPI0008529A83|nr:ROK family protein [Tepidibacillus sp. HK-1]GBF10273.1 glucokinase [Tepidibacillus sp. HK-1]